MKLFSFYSDSYDWTHGTKVKGNWEEYYNLKQMQWGEGRSEKYFYKIVTFIEMRDNWLVQDASIENKQ